MKKLSGVRIVAGKSARGRRFAITVVKTMSSELRPGETLDMNTRVDGGPTVYRDSVCPDCFAIDRHGGELSREEIGRLAEVAGLEVNY